MPRTTGRKPVTGFPVFCWGPARPLPRHLATPPRHRPVPRRGRACRCAVRPASGTRTPCRFHRRTTKTRPAPSGAEFHQGCGVPCCSARPRSPRPLRHPAARPSAAEPIVIVGPISSATGFGESARLAMRTFAAKGLMSAASMSARSCWEATRPSRSTLGSGHDRAGHGDPACQRAAGSAGPADARPPALRGKRIIGYFAWELRRTFRPTGSPHLDHVHEIWAPSRFTAEAFRRHTSRPVHVVPHPVAVSRAGR